MAVLSPYDALSAKTLAMQQWDDAEARRRQTRTYGPGDIGQQAYFNTFNDAQTDAATGPSGYNRQWVPLLESLKGKRLVGGGGLPTSTYGDPEHTGHMRLLDEPSVKALKNKTAPVDDFESFQRQLYGEDPAHWPAFYHGQGATPAAAAPAAPPAVPRRPLLPANATQRFSASRFDPTVAATDDDAARLTLQNGARPAADRSPFSASLLDPTVPATDDDAARFSLQALMTRLGR